MANNLGNVLAQIDSNDPVAVAQGILAVALSLTLVGFIANILFKLLVVSWALVAAAFKYSAVALLIVVIIALLFD